MSTPKTVLYDCSRELNQRFITELTRLASRLLEVIAMSLGLPSHALHSLFQPADSSRVRLNHYPVTPDAPEDSFGVSHHKDSGFLTVLLQDEQVSGLQVRGGLHSVLAGLQELAESVRVAAVI